MVTDDELAKLVIRHIIFHDVPNNAKGSGNKLILAETDTELDPQRANVLKNRLVQVLGSKSAYPVEFQPESLSPVPDGIRAFTTKSHQLKDFVDMSQLFAKYLFEQQSGAISPGLLCVADVASGSRAGLAMLKLEREQGAELELSEKNGKRMFAMSVLDNLVLTDGTRLFKSALFLRASANRVIAAACDSQRKTTTSDDVARFWLRFLGCQFVEDPRVVTQKWFDSTVRFINEEVTDSIQKNDVYEHLVSELKSNRKNIAPRSFVEDYIPRAYRKRYVEYLTNHSVPLHNFEKNTSDIQAKLRRKSFHTERGVTVTAPADSELVDVREKDIVVRDQLRSIAHK